jgi:hypothetical protein
MQADNHPIKFEKIEISEGGLISTQLKIFMLE